MDDPELSWPAWKFGMKRADLFTKLHDQYNTIPSSIQDPEAFHHDVYELSTEATTADQFHALMSERKEQRIRELNDTLESASFEIVANPSLIGTKQWEYALQLFRTRSLDSLVRYFASYLPSDHPWYHNDQHDAQDEQQNLFFNDSVVTHEPLSYGHDDLPPSPRSLTSYSDDSNVTNLTDARTLSFSESEPDHLDDCSSSSISMSMPPPLYCSSAQDSDDEPSPSPSMSETPESSVPDPAEHAIADDVKIASGKDDEAVELHEDSTAHTKAFVTTELTSTITNNSTSTLTLSSATSSTPTPKASPSCMASAGFCDPKPCPLLSPVRIRSLSTSSHHHHPWPVVATATASDLSCTEPCLLDCRKKNDESDDDNDSLTGRSVQAAAHTVSSRRRMWRGVVSREAMEQRGMGNRIQKMQKGTPQSTRTRRRREESRNRRGNGSGDDL